MLLALGATAIVIIALMWEVAWPSIEEKLEQRRARRAKVTGVGYDPGRERRAEQRARQLLKSCVNEEEWAMYRDLGFVRVWGRLADGPEQGGTTRPRRRAVRLPGLPHKPIVAYLPQTRGC
jgi:hypothetical protein